MYRENKINGVWHLIASLSLLTLLIGCAETLPLNNGSALEFDQNRYLTADPYRGGRLYDKWWAEKGQFTSPIGSNPIWQEIPKDTAGNPLNTHGNDGGQWRCKECHGWDYKGVNGAYGNSTSSHYTGIIGLNNGNASFDAEHVFGMITNGEVSLNGKSLPHVFYEQSSKLDEQDVYDLTKFVIEIARIDNINPSFGESAQGKAVYTRQTNTGLTCESAGCHKNNKSSIVGVAQDNPQEFLHKVRYGNPGTFMPSGLNNQDAVNLWAYVNDGAQDVTIPESDFSSDLYNRLDESAVVKGGLLYDKWWKVASTATEPGASENHSLWPSSNTQISGSGTWRCKECHGWDYRGKDGAYKEGKHYTGFAGIIDIADTNMNMLTADNVYSYLKTSSFHGFDNGFFTDTEYYNLTKFIMTIRAEAANNQASFNFIDDTTGLAKNANQTTGKTLFDGNVAQCAACHGADGKTIDFGDGDSNTLPNVYVHDIASENPWEFIHKVRYGQPASAMSGLYDKSDNTVNTLQAAVDILAYSQTTLVPNIKRAGLLYDKWWKVDGVLSSNEPATRNRTWVSSDGTSNSELISNSSTWRCKQCHGWDYDGENGAYGDITSKNYSGIRGFYSLTTVTKSKNEIINTITNGISQSSTTLLDHDFGKYLSAQDIELLADFITNGAAGIPTQKTAYTDALNNGNSSTGKSIYESDSPGHCINCHGDDGTLIPTVDIGAIAKSNPQEFIHKSRYGHPASTMLPSSSGFTGLTLNESSHVLAYSKTLGASTEVPTYENASMVRGGRLYDKWWKEMQVTDSNVTAPTGINPIWDQTRGTTPTDLTKTWRCKSCHAWNYKGYVAGSGDDLIEKIEARRQIYTEQQTRTNIFNWIKFGAGSSIGHNYGEVSTENSTPLTDREVWDLTKFLLGGGLLDTAIFINEGTLKNGVVEGADIVNGKGLYTGSVDNDINCVSCHGADGMTSPPTSSGGSGDPLDIFAIAAAMDDPWEFLHKTRFGQPGSTMPALLGTNSLTDQDAIDVLGYAQDEFNNRQTTQQ